MQVIYYDGGDNEKRQKVAHVLDQFALSYRILNENDMFQTLGYLMQIDGYDKKDSLQDATFSEDLLILNDLDDESIQALSRALREQACQVERKAMLTIHNKDWTLSSLLKEIIREHAYFKSYDQLKQCIIEASELDKESYTIASWQPYQETFLQGYAYLQEQEVAKELLDMSIEQIQSTKQNLQLKK